MWYTVINDRIYIGGRIEAIESKSYLKNTKIVVPFIKQYPQIDLFLSYQEIDKKIKSRKGIYPIYLF